MLILLTVGWKMAVPTEGATDLNEDLIALFKVNNFSILQADQVTQDGGAADVPIIQVKSDSCAFRVAALSFDGSNRQFVERRLAGAGRRFVVFQGKVYPEQPIFLTVTNYLWSRFLTRLGLGRRIAPPIAIASDASCNAELLPWAELRW